MRRLNYLNAHLLFCVAALTSASASAADMPAPPPAYVSPVPPTWTGFYVGLGGGASSLNNRINAQPGPSPDSPGISAALNGLGANGWLATISAGFDYQVSPSVVIGIFGDYDFNQIRSQLDLNVAGAPFSAHGDISINQQWSIGARIGYLASPSTLIFLSGGYTHLGLSDFRVSVSAGDPATLVSTFASVPSIGTGFIGAGVETKLTNKISLRGEYRYAGFGSGAVILPTIDGTNLNDFVTARIAPTFQTVKATLNYRF
jgi:outer membrane immunogenic protein